MTPGDADFSALSEFGRAASRKTEQGQKRLRERAAVVAASFLPLVTFESLKPGYGRRRYFVSVTIFVTTNANFFAMLSSSNQKNPRHGPWYGS